MGQAPAGGVTIPVLDWNPEPGFQIIVTGTCCNFNSTPGLSHSIVRSESSNNSNSSINKSYKVITPHCAARRPRHCRPLHRQLAWQKRTRRPARCTDFSTHLAGPCLGSAWSGSSTPDPRWPRWPHQSFARDAEEATALGPPAGAETGDSHRPTFLRHVTQSNLLQLKIYKPYT